MLYITVTLLNSTLPSFTITTHYFTTPKRHYALPKKDLQIATNYPFTLHYQASPPHYAAESHLAITPFSFASHYA
jgi:hypothetical protein